MRNNPTTSRFSISTQSLEKQAIRESLAPFAPFPEALNHDQKNQSGHHVLLKKTKKRIN